MAYKAKLDREIERTEEVTKENKKVKVFVPRDNLNPKQDSIIVGINELYAKIPLGEPIEVTEEVAEVLRNSGYIY